jgi:pyrroloquinoline quinone (PQQ) biosynthesis protein C
MKSEKEIAQRILSIYGHRLRNLKSAYGFYKEQGIQYMWDNSPADRAHLAEKSFGLAMANDWSTELQDQLDSAMCAMYNREFSNPIPQGQRAAYKELTGKDI